MTPKQPEGEVDAQDLKSAEQRPESAKGADGRSQGRYKPETCTNNNFPRSYGYFCSIQFMEFQEVKQRTQ